MAKIKVKQSTIDEIKKMGMTKALGAAKTRRSAEYQEAVKRMYGAKRVAKATAGASRSTQPVGGVMGTKRARVMAGPVKSTVKSTAKKVAAKRSTGAVQQALAARAPKSKMFSNLGAGVSVPRDKQPKRAKSGKTFKQKFNTKTKKFGTPN
jgi:hypothetical protein